MRWIAILPSLLLGLSTSTPAEEIRVVSKVESVALFKNGLVVVQRTVEVPGPGDFLLDDVPEPVHGTFWIESEMDVEARLVSRSAEVPLRSSHAIDFQNDLAGKDVTVHLDDPSIAPIRGTVLELEPQQKKMEHSPGSAYWPSEAKQDPRFLILATAQGRVYLTSSRIAYVRVEGVEKGGLEPSAKTVMERKPVLLLQVDGKAKGPQRLAVSYLTRGLSWAPSYRIDISDPEELKVEQRAIIKNELVDLEEVEIYLTSGFPSIRFGHVTSLLSPQTSWAQFVNQLEWEPRSRRGSGASMQQQVSTFDPVDPGLLFDPSTLATAENTDMHHQSIDRRSLRLGEVLSVPVASGRSPYARIVEWIVPDTREADGRYVSEHERKTNPQTYRDAAWDAIRFRNPLPFPMSTGAALVVEGGRFQGQSMSSWVQAGSAATLHVTKALSIRTRSVEHEEPNTREEIEVSGRSYRKVQMRGELVVRSLRKSPVEVVVRRQLSGELLEADGEPRVALREEGIWSVNPRNELTWSMGLDPGAERTLSYRYSVLVRR